MSRTRTFRAKGGPNDGQTVEVPVDKYGATPWSIPLPHYGEDGQQVDTTYWLEDGAYVYRDPDAS